MSKKSSKKPKDASDDGGGGGGGEKKAVTKKKGASSASALASLTAGGGGFGSGFGAAFVSSIASSGDDSSGSGSGMLSGGLSSASRVLECGDGEINFVFRKLVKKDAITKLKALEELKGLFESKPKDAIAECVPAFINHFDRIAIDNDRKVREALYGAMVPLIRSVSKGLARHIRQLFPNWWLHMFDPSREVSKLARGAFEVAFPVPAKVPDVLKYCQSEYLARVKENLVATPESLSDMKVTSAADAEERYERVMSSTLTSLASYIESLPEDANRPLFGGADGAYADILSAAQWKLTLTSKRPLIRKAMLVLLKAVTTKAKQYTERELSVLSPIILSTFDERMSFNTPLVWELILSFLKAYPACWTHVVPSNAAGAAASGAAASASVDSKSKKPAAAAKAPKAPIFPRLLFDAVQTGGHGSPRVVYPYLLPLLSCIPQRVIIDAARSAPADAAAPAASDDQLLTAFYNQFLSAIWAGLRGAKPAAAPASAAAAAPAASTHTSTAVGAGAVSAVVASDTKLVVDTYFECVLIVIATTKKSYPATAKAILYDRIFPHLRACLVGGDAAAAASATATAHVMTVAGRTLAGIERQLLLAANPATPAPPSPAAATEQSKSAESHADTKHAPAATATAAATAAAALPPVQYDMKQFWDSISELCVHALTAAQPKPNSAALASGDEKAAPAATAAAPSTVKAADVYEHVALLLCHAQHERLKIRATKHDVSAAVTSAQDRAFVHSVVANVFAIGWECFASNLTSPRLTMKLAETFGLSAILQSDSTLLPPAAAAAAASAAPAAAAGSGESRFLTERLLPVLTTYCGVGTKTLAPTLTLAQSIGTLESFSSLLASAVTAVSTAGASSAAAVTSPFWDAVITRLSGIDTERQPFGIYVIRHVLDRMIATSNASHTSVTGRGDKIMTAQLGAFFRCHESQKIGEYSKLFDLCFNNSVLSGAAGGLLLQSIADALKAALLSPPPAAGAAESAQSALTPSRIVLARLVHAIRPVVSSAARFTTATAGAAAGASSGDALRASLLRSVFWLRCTSTDELAEACAVVWAGIEPSEIEPAAGTVRTVCHEIATSLQTALFDGTFAPISASVQASALASVDFASFWGVQVSDLLDRTNPTADSASSAASTAALAGIKQQLISVVVSTRERWHALLASAEDGTAAVSLPSAIAGWRRIRNGIAQLMNRPNGVRTLFELSHQRLWLLGAVLALEQLLRWQPATAAAAAAVTTVAGSEDEQPQQQQSQQQPSVFQLYQRAILLAPAQLDSLSARAAIHTLAMAACAPSVKGATPAQLTALSIDAAQALRALLDTIARPPSQAVLARATRRPFGGGEDSDDDESGGDDDERNAAAIAAALAEDESEADADDDEAVRQALLESKLLDDRLQELAGGKTSDEKKSSALATSTVSISAKPAPKPTATPTPIASASATTNASGAKPSAAIATDAKSAAPAAAGGSTRPIRQPYVKGRNTAGGVHKPPTSAFPPTAAASGAPAVVIATVGDTKSTPPAPVKESKTVSTPAPAAALPTDILDAGFVTELVDAYVIAPLRSSTALTTLTPAAAHTVSAILSGLGAGVLSKHTPSLIAAIKQLFGVTTAFVGGSGFASLSNESLAGTFGPIIECIAALLEVILAQRTSGAAVSASDAAAFASVEDTARALFTKCAFPKSFTLDIYRADVAFFLGARARLADSLFIKYKQIVQPTAAAAAPASGDAADVQKAIAISLQLPAEHLNSMLTFISDSVDYATRTLAGSGVTLSSGAAVAAMKLTAADSKSDSKSDRKDGGVPLTGKSFVYIESCLSLLHSILLSSLPALQSPDTEAGGNLKVLELSRPALGCMRILTSPAMFSLFGGVARYERALESLSDVLQLYFATSVSRQPATLAFVSEPAVLNRLCQLLAHASPSITVTAYKLLSVSLCDRAMRAEVKADDAKDAPPPSPAPVDSASETGSEAGSGEERMNRREARLRAERVRRERDRLRARVDKLIPAPLRDIIESSAVYATAAVSGGSAPAALPASTLFRSSGNNSLPVRGHLLGWCLVLDIVAQSNAVKRSVIVGYLRELDVVSPVLNEIFEHLNVSDERTWTLVDPITKKRKLIAAEPAAAPAVDAKADPTAAAASLVSGVGSGVVRAMCIPHGPRVGVRVAMHMRRLWNLRRVPTNSTTQTGIKDESCFYPALCSHLYLRTLRSLPALSRMWWSTCTGNTSAISKFTAKHYSPLLIEDEIRAISGDGKSSIDDDSGDTTFKIRGSLSLSEVSAKYQRAEIQLGLTIKLQDAYPLVPVKTEFTEKVRLKEGNTRKWQLAIASILASANGTLRDAILVWKRNVDKHLDGIEECPVCMFVVEATTHTLPNLVCRTCKKKFHSHCLHKWFNTSGKSACPMCRNLF